MANEELKFLIYSFCGGGLRFVIKTLPTTFRTKNKEQKAKVREDIKQRIIQEHTKKSCERFFDSEIKIELTCYFNNRYAITDVDNIAKFTLDAMKDLAFKDDKQIKELIVRKLKAKKGANEYIGVGISKINLETPHKLEKFMRAKRIP